MAGMGYGCSSRISDIVCDSRLGATSRPERQHFAIVKGHGACNVVVRPTQ